MYKVYFVLYKLKSLTYNKIQPIHLIQQWVNDRIEWANSLGEGNL